MKDPVLKIQLLTRAELVLARIRTRKAVTKILFAGVGLIFTLLGLVMLNLAAYYMFADRFSPAQSSLFVALADIGAGGVIFLIAAKVGKAGNEETMAEEIRDLAFSELNADVDAFKQELSGVRDDVHRIRSGFSSVADSTGSVIPLLSMLTKALRKK